jgi:hypothetical protein
LNEAAVSEVSSKLLEVGVVFQGGGAHQAHECDALNALLGLAVELATKIAPDDRSDWHSVVLHEARRYKIIDAIINIDMQDRPPHAFPRCRVRPTTRMDLGSAFENRWQAHDARPGATPSGS